MVKRGHLRLVKPGESGPPPSADWCLCPGCGEQAVKHDVTIACGHCVSTFRLLPMPGPAQHWLRVPAEGGEGASCVLVTA